MLRNKKRTILFFVSLIGIVVTSLVLVSTYAYQSVRTEYAPGADSDLSINVGKLEVNYTASNKIELGNMTALSDYQTADYLEFTLDSTNSTDDVAYYISLENITYSTALATKDFKYTLVKVNSNGTHTFLNKGDFSTLNGTEFEINKVYNRIVKGTTETLRLYLWLKDSENINSSLESASFTGTVKITSVFLSDVPNKKLSDTLLLDNNITKNSTTPEFTGIADYVTTGDSSSGELGMYKAEDDYGDSWYFRGAQSYNYVNFAGFTWRIVRINGDGSIRLILDGTLDKLTTDFTELVPYNVDQQTNNSSDNAYIGYMYGIVGSDNYSDTHKNINDSSIKTQIDSFYEKYLAYTYINESSEEITNSSNVDVNNNKYEDFLADTLFCGDKTLSSPEVGVDNTLNGYGKMKTYYAASGRLFYDSNNSNEVLTIATPTLKCGYGNGVAPSNNVGNVYSRYTVDNYNINGSKTNGDLKYPIALLSADEIVMAGGYVRTSNMSYYLYDAFIDEKLSRAWWLMTPHFYNGGTNSIIFVSVADSHSLHAFVAHNLTTYAIRPVINLKNDVIVLSGDGTKTEVKDESGNIISGPYNLSL